ALAGRAVAGHGANSRQADNQRRRQHPAEPSMTGPVTELRAWIDRLAATDRLAIAREEVKLRFELAAIAKRLDGTKATLFPKPDGHSVPVVSGLVSSRAWIAEAMGVGEDRMLAHFQHAALNPVP